MKRYLSINLQFNIYVFNTNPVEVDTNSVEFNINPVEIDINSLKADIKLIDFDINSIETDTNPVGVDTSSVNIDIKRVGTDTKSGGSGISEINKEENGMRIGVTGIFASGKGTVCEMFRELGAGVVDTDIVAREIMEPGTEGLKRVVEEFGDSFINSDGTLDRRGFANSVFTSAEKVKRLNELTHPLILDIVTERTSGKGIFMVNTPLLFESGFDKYMEKNIVVTAGNDQVLVRGSKRDNISLRR